MSAHHTPHPTAPATPADALTAALAHASHRLPTQRPIDAFVHHNTLHAFENEHFETGVEHAAAELGAEPWLSETEYRAAFAAGRILTVDVAAAVTRRVADEALPGLRVGRREAVRRLMLHQQVAEAGARLAWRLSETDVLQTLPEALPRDARERLLEAGRPTEVMPALWAACQWPDPQAPAMTEAGRLAPLVLVRSGESPDRLAEPVFIRWASAFLDPAFAHWPMAERAEGFYAAALNHFATETVEPRRWFGEVVKHAKVLKAAGTSAADAAVAVLGRMGVPVANFDTVVAATLDRLPGWAGMFETVGLRPDLNPGPMPVCRLVDFLAVRLLFDEAAARFCLRLSGQPDTDATLASLWAERATPALLNDPARVEDHDRTLKVTPWFRFHAARALGVTPDELAAPSGAETRASIDDLLRTAGHVFRRRLWQLAYERRYRVQVLDAMLAATPAELEAATPPAPFMQVINCIDDRHESFRRHLEEIEPNCETFGAAGFFGVAMAFQPLGETRTRPLCPALRIPRHVVSERVASGAESAWARARRTRTTTGRMMQLDSDGNRSLVKGGPLSLLGLWAAVPMAVRLLAPRRHGRFVASRVPEVRTELVLRHVPGTPNDAEGRQQGYTDAEMADIVAGVMADMGLVTASQPSRLAPLVFVLGHGASSVNNPYAAGYNCGACGGNKGGPNGRAFATIANDPTVRGLLRDRGINIPDATWFVGGYNDTTADGVRLEDLDLVPAAHRSRLDQALAIFDEARRRNAHERCRRFEDAPLDLTPHEALRHAESRSHDLAQARPEYNHAGNATQVLGRRTLTRGLFLDRRVFLTSYEPGVDPEGRILAGILGALGPVGAGINLEYFFSFVDRRRYGCDSKLPQNLVGLLGVMDGHQSDLRTGLVWQMVEIHEPMRLLNVIEATPEQLGKVMERIPHVVPLVANEWLLVVAWDPATRRMWNYEDGQFVPYTPETHTVPTVRHSVDWYQGRRDNLPPVRVVAEPKTSRADHGKPSAPGADHSPAGREVQA